MEVANKVHFYVSYFIGVSDLLMFVFFCIGPLFGG
jgi:hypothetical protein